MGYWLFPLDRWGHTEAQRGYMRSHVVKGMELGFPHRSAVFFTTLEAQPVLNWENPDSGGTVQGYRLMTLSTGSFAWACLVPIWSGVHRTLSPGDQSLLLLGLPLWGQSLISTASLGLAGHLVQVWVGGLRTRPILIPYPLTQLPEDTGYSRCGLRRPSGQGVLFGDRIFALARCHGVWSVTSRQAAGSFAHICHFFPLGSTLPKCSALHFSSALPNNNSNNPISPASGDEHWFMHSAIYPCIGSVFIE